MEEIEEDDEEEEEAGSEEAEEGAPLLEDESIPQVIDRTNIYTGRSILSQAEAALPSGPISIDASAADLRKAATERSPLLASTLARRGSQSRSRSRRRRSSVGPHGDATVAQAVLMERLVMCISIYAHLSHPAAEILRWHWCPLSRQSVSRSRSQWIQF